MSSTQPQPDVRAKLNDYSGQSPIESVPLLTREDLAPKAIDALRSVLAECDYLLLRGEWLMNVQRIKSLIEEALS